MWEFVLKYWLEITFSTVLAVIGAGLKYMAKKIKEEHKEQQDMKNALLALLHDRHYQYAEFILKKSKKNITTEDMENLEYLFRSYEKLGGNGTGKMLYNACRKKFEGKGMDQ